MVYRYDTLQASWCSVQVILSLQRKCWDLEVSDWICSGNSRSSLNQTHLNAAAVEFMIVDRQWRWSALHVNDFVEQHSWHWRKAECLPPTPHSYILHRLCFVEMVINCKEKNGNLSIEKNKQVTNNWMFYGTLFHIVSLISKGEWNHGIQVEQKISDYPGSSWTQTFPTHTKGGLLQGQIFRFVGICQMIQIVTSKKLVTERKSLILSREIRHSF